MTDPRIAKLAQVLVHYSLELKPGDQVAIQTTPLAEELNRAVYKDAVQAGAHPYVHQPLVDGQEILLKYGSDAQLDYVSPLTRLVYEEFDAILSIDAPANTRSLANVNSERQSRQRRSTSGLVETFFKRMGSDDLNWCGTVFPTNALAQEADMSLSEYEDFVYTAGMLHLDDPVAAWKEEATRQQKLIDWLAGHDQVTLKSSDIDLSLSIKDRRFLQAAGKENFPDGEIYTSPVETSVNGWVRFEYPAIYMGQEVIDVELWFEDGKVVKEKASKGKDFLSSMLNADEGGRRLGELGIGTNYQIPRFTKSMLFDEKLGGTIHLAVGKGFPEIGGQNQSSVHWDMLCDMSDGEIRVDGELFYKDGHFTGAELASVGK